MRVLIADDDPTVRELLSAVFEGSDLEVSLARDGEEALAAAHRTRPDCVILDVMMPKLDGVSVCRQLRADPRTAQTRIVMLTASPLAGSPEFMTAGADAWLPKPFGALALMDAVIGRTLVVPSRKKATR